MQFSWNPFIHTNCVRAEHVWCWCFQRKHANIYFVSVGIYYTTMDRMQFVNNSLRIPPTFAKKRDSFDRRREKKNWNKIRQLVYRTTVLMALLFCNIMMIFFRLSMENKQTTATQSRWKRRTTTQQSENNNKIKAQSKEGKKTNDWMIWVKVQLCSIVTSRSVPYSQGLESYKSNLTQSNHDSQMMLYIFSIHIWKMNE